MSAVSPWPAAVVLGLAVMTAWLIGRICGVMAPVGRYRSIEGLRGYLALGVFLHHACIWFFYRGPGQVWAVPPSPLYTQLGQAGVAFFFMITGFLFFSKLLDRREQGLSIDWPALFLSRVRRLVPLYLFAMLLMALCVAQVSGWQLREEGWTLLRHALSWLVFTFWGHPDLNGVPHTFTLVAGVTWSLPYEWLFYASLPMMGWMIGLSVPKAWRVLGGLALLMLLVRKPVLIHVASFAVGMLSAWVARRPSCQVFAAGPHASWWVLGLLGAEMVLFDTAYGLPQLIMLGIVFGLIASGNTLFGLLTKRVSYVLGQMAYSLYMLHGLCLFSVFHLLQFGLGTEPVSAEMHWWTVWALVPVLVSLSFLSFLFLERPFMNHSQRGLVA